MELKNIKLGELKTYSKNNKIHPPDQIKKIARSIKEFGFNVPVIIDKNNVIIAGHGRVFAAKELGMEDIPVLQKDNLSEAQIKAYRIADNKTAESEWDFDSLKEEFKTLKELDFDLELTGFTFDEISEFNDIGQEIVQEVEADNPNEIETKIKSGDIFSIGDHRLMCGDSTKHEDVALLMQDDKADLLLTDPPYNIDFKYNNYNDKKTNIDYKQFIVLSIIKNETKNKIITCGKQNLKMWFEIVDITDIAIWYSKNKMSGGKISNLSLWEPILFIGKFNRNTIPSDVFESTNEIQKDVENHPCPKTVKLFSELLKYSKENDIVYEPFGGSGTTMIAAHQLKRKCFMMEIDPSYCQVIINRMQKLASDINIQCLNRSLII